MSELMDDETVREEPQTTAGRGAAPSARPDAPPGPWALYLAVLLIVAAACGLLFLKPVASAEAGPGSASGSEVIGQVGDGLVRIFTYRDDDLTATEQAATDLLRDRALEQYRQLFTQVRAQAPTQKLAVTTRVVRAGIIQLSGDEAELLVFLDQTTTRAGQASGTPAAAQLVVRAHREGGKWKITELRAS